MFNLLRRSRNRKSQYEDNENPASRSSSHNALHGLNPELEVKNPANVGCGSTKDRGKKITGEREEKFAMIYFESSKGKNKNVADEKTETDGKGRAYFASRSSSSRSSVLTTNNDSASTLYQEYDHLAKGKITKRKSLAFRRIDLDGINSIVEAIALDGNDIDGDHDDYAVVSEKETSIIGTTDVDYHHHHHLQNDRPDSERYGADLVLLSQNKRSEWSGRNSSTICDVTKTDYLQSKAFNYNELNATKSIRAPGNVRGIINKDEATTTERKHSSFIECEGIVKSIEKVSADNPKQEKQVRRRSYFLRKSHDPSITTDVSVPNSQGKLNKSDRTEVKTSHGPLQKGKKFLSNIFMTRGRYQRNQQNQQNQQNQRNHSQVLKQQSSSKHQLQQQKSCSSKSNNKHYAAVVKDHRNCQNITSNEDDSIIRNDIRHNQDFIPNDQNNGLVMLRQRHLESTTTNSPIRQRDPADSVQISLSNNSHNNSSQRDVAFGDRGKSQHRSNSAELPRERREIDRSNRQDGNKSERAYSEEPQHQPGAHTSANARAPFTMESLKNLTTTSGSLHDVHSLTRAKSIGRNGINAENSDGGCTVKNTDQEVNSNDECAALLDELTECARRGQSELSQNQEQNIEKRLIFVDAISMGQTYGKNETSEENTRASSPREFRQSIVPEAGDTSNLQRSAAVTVPKITIEDFSANKSVPASNSHSLNESEVFYEFEREGLESAHFESSIADGDSDNDDEVFHEQVAATQPASFSTYRQHSPLRHHSPVKLEDVPEQEEDEDDDEANGEDSFHTPRFRRPVSYSTSPERFPLKSSDSNLSNSYPDSGISGCSEPSHVQSMQETSTLTRSSLPTQSHQQSLSQPQRRSQHRRQRQRSPYVRDSTSTECDDTILQNDEFDCFTSTSTSTPETIISGSVGDRLVCIESISLPDVVESTTSAPGSGSGNGQNGSTAASAASSGVAAGEQIININGATGNCMGNVHFIPIHVEADRCRGGGIRSNSPSQQKQQRSLDDNFIGNGMNSARFAHINGGFDLSEKPTIEIIEDDEPTKLNKNNTSFGINSDKLRFEFDEQKSRLNTELDNAQKNVQNLQTKITEMQAKIGNLEQELSTKTWNVERLQSELNASQREDDFVRKKLRLLQEEKTELRHKFNENEDEFRTQYDELDAQYKELQEKYKNTQHLASSLHTQLAAAQNEVEEWRNQAEKIRSELEEQIRILKNALENSEAERTISEDKWQTEYELLRTQHMDHEETLMTDCEWQLRQMQRQWKDKLDKSENARRDAIENAELIGIELENRKREVEDLQHYEAEVKSLRGVITEQQNSISILMNQIEDLKSDIKIANAKLEDQIEAVAKIKFQCDNAICDKERQMVYRIDEVRNEAACFWENKLYTEMTRLKTELESVYVDERREALDKLQAEHIEELRALTTRYTANEEELRIELAELQEKFERKSSEFLELRQKSDNALLQTRMHLDRADREYQNAMCREDERREALEETLRQEFEAEKQEMELKFHERLHQVKEEFAIELQNSKQELNQKHQKDLEQIKAKLRAEKDEALQELAERHRQKLTAAEDQMREIELRHQNDLKDLKATYDEDKAVLDKRDMSNANEIEQLHRRCRCLTNLFEEMRMRYERRDPRPEDLREIDELRTRCESQERDLFTLTATLREMQMKQQNGNKTGSQTKKSGAKSVQKPPPKTIPTNCDVIYEENEERDSPPPLSIQLNHHQNPISMNTENSDEDTEEDNEENDDENDEEDENDVENENKLQAAA